MLWPRNLLKLHSQLWQCNYLQTAKSLLISARALQTTNAALAGHSKWANIRHIKAAKDGQRSVLFSRISRQIRLAVQEGGSADPNLNTQLRSIVEQALRQNMPMATVQASIKKCQQAKTDLKRYLLELRYKQKVFLLVVVYTDNFPHVKMEMATVNRKFGAAPNDILHLFEEFGLITATLEADSSFLEELATEAAIECGAEDVEVIDAEAGQVNFICRPIDLNTVRRALEEKGYKVDNMEHAYAANNLVQLNAEELEAYEKYTQRLRDLSGVEDIYDNVQLPS